MKNLVLIALFMMLVGCASPWIRPAGKTVIEAQDDVSECEQISRAAAQGFYRSYYVHPYHREQSSFKGCMASRGYTKE